MSKRALTIENVSKSFGSKQVLRTISLAVDRGQVFGFLGPNGAGKTTTIRCLMDYIRPNAGTITIFDRDAQKKSTELKSLIGYLPAESELHDEWTAADHLRLAARIKGDDRNMQALVERLQVTMKVPIRKLSTGNRQKVAIALAFLGSPPLLIMDEPTRGLDPFLQSELYTMIDEYKKAGGTVFFSSHNLDEVQRLCDSVAIIKDGHVLVAESMQEILSLTTHIMRVTTATALDIPTLARLKATVVNQSAAVTTLKVRDNLPKILEFLGHQKIIDIEITHASLEDIFMEYYR